MIEAHFLRVPSLAYQTCGPRRSCEAVAGPQGAAAAMAAAGACGHEPHGAGPMCMSKHQEIMASG
eukprot:6111431-Prymnesium_polylepis.2